MATKTYVMNHASTFLNGVEYSHGDEIELDALRGVELAEQGVVVAKSEWAEHQADAGKVDEKQAKAEADARDAAAEIEASKEQSIEQVNAERVVPAKRGRPAS